MAKKWISIVLLFLASYVFAPACFSQESQPAKTTTIRYLFSIDAVASGFPLVGVRTLFVDNAHEELYILDDSNKRVVITDSNGIFLYQFKYTDAGVKSMPVGIAAAEDGLLYIAEEKRIVITSYRGIYKKDMDFSTVPNADKMVIQSIAVEGDKLYLGDGVNGRILVMDRKKEAFVAEFKEGIAHNSYLSLDNDGIYIMDPPMFSIIHLDKNGKLLGRWGMASSLPGGFSMTVSMAVDRKNGRVTVLDLNRYQVIFFDRQGKFLFEFGGSDIFKTPSAVAVDDKERVYVFDASGKIRVFQLMEEAPPLPVVEVKKEPEPVPSPPEPIKEVEKMVETEKRLLPVFFDVDSAKLKSADFEILDKDIAWLKENPGTKINVRGYADERGTDAYNLKLSKARAKAVMDYFVKNGIDAKRLKFVGFGRVISTDKSEEALRQNRRVDFLVVE